MKKTVVFVLALALCSVALIGASVRAEETLEKIPSPDQIKNFKVMKREGGVLFGIRLQDKNMNLRSEKATSTMVKNTMQAAPEKAGMEKLEKIAAPQMIGLYEKIRQVGSALWGVRKGGATQEAKKQPVLITSEMAACVGAAIDVKDSALKSLVSDMSVSLQGAIDDRNACQKAALNSTSSQQKENEACVKSFQEKNKELHTKNREGHQKAWTDYKNSLQLCRPSTVTEGSVMLEDGSEKMMETVSGMMVE